MLFSSEAMVYITKKELKILSQIDANFLRKLAGVGKGCPTELLYLIFGVRPIEYITKCCRLNFLHYILKQNNESLIYKVFQPILENPVKNDWVSSAKKTIEELNLNMTFSEIKHIDTKKFKYIVRQKSFQKSLEYLKMEQMKHSKSKHFIFEKFEIQDYLLPDINISNEDRKFLISLQCRMIEIKSNFPSKYKDLTCEAGCGEKETMNHIIHIYSTHPYQGINILIRQCQYNGR